MTVARTSSLFVLLVVVVSGAVLLSAIAFASMAHSGWDMGWRMGDHMGQMMGGGTNTSNSALAVGSTSESVSIRDFAFAPGNLQVPVGSKVTWVNYDDAPHNAKAKDGAWDTGMLSKDESKTLTFDKAGDYTYKCTVHPSMVARLQVR